MTATHTGTEVQVHQDTTVIGLVGFAHSISHFNSLLIPSLIPWLMPAFGLSYTQVGGLMTVFFIISGSGQSLAGFAVDRIGSLWVLCFGLFAMALSATLLACATNYPTLVVVAVLAGLGICVFHPADFGLLNRRVSPARLGHAFSVHGLSGYLGFAACPVLIVGIASVAGWRIAALSDAALGGVALAFMLSCRRLLDDREAAAETKPASTAGAAAETASARGAPLAFIRSPVVWLCFCFFFFATMAVAILQVFAPVLLNNVYGLSLALAGTSLTAYMLGAAAGTVTGGFVANRAGHARVVACALGSAAAAALLVASGLPPGWAVPAILGAMGFGVGIAGPSRDLLVRQAATRGSGKAAYGRVYGFVYSGLDFGFALVPMIFGPMLDAGHYSPVLYCIAVLQILAVLTALRVGSSSQVASLRTA